MPWLQVPSLHSHGYPGLREGDPWLTKLKIEGMEAAGSVRARQGMVVRIYDDMMVVERRELEDSRVAAQRAYNSLSQREKDAINEQRRQQQLHDKAVSDLQKLLKGNTVGAGFSRTTRGLNLPVAGGTLTQEGFGATIKGNPGDAVRTIHEGIVQEIQYKPLTNRYTIFLGYNEYLVTYTNLSSVCVKKGDIVAKDQKIGVIGSGIDSDDKPFVRLAIYDCQTSKPLYVSDFFKKL
jgi:murein DD-endopeptidase MepM/ murein hydrolase activator NlpD